MQRSRNIGKCLTLRVASVASICSAVAAIARSATPMPGWLRRQRRPSSPARRVTDPLTGTQAIRANNRAAALRSEDRSPWMTSIRLTSKQEGRSSRPARYSVAKAARRRRGERPRRTRHPLRGRGRDPRFFRPLASTASATQPRPAPPARGRRRPLGESPSNGTFPPPRPARPAVRSACHRGRSAYGSRCMDIHHLS